MMNPKDLTFQSYRNGASFNNPNFTVRVVITHRPTGVQGTAEARSEFKARREAMLDLEMNMEAETDG